ncbi:MAG: glycosyltransferase family 4 protein [Burkholderiales bacterium]
MATENRGKPRLLFIVNVDWFFLSHRLPIALHAMQAGYEVHLAVGLTDRLPELAAHGLTVHPIALRRAGIAPLAQVRSFLQMLCVLRRVRPDVLHLVTVKPVVFGGIAARLLRVPTVVAAVPGLGYVFTAQGRMAALARGLLAWLYRLALRSPRVRVLFQNPDDRQRLIEAARLDPARTQIIRGSGVDLARYAATPLPPGVPLVVLVARLLHDKGVHEFVQAARELRAGGHTARFALVGAPDVENRASIGAHQLARWRAEGAVELWGQREDIPAVLAQAHIVVLPSYREGLPKVLLEAAACARAVVTTDVPGCRDAIEPDVTGLLVPARDAAALAAAIARLLDDRALCERFGRAGRTLAEREFDIDQIVAEHLALYREGFAVR